MNRDTDDARGGSEAEMPFGYGFDAGRLWTAPEAKRATMELHQVRYFLAVCECLNFTRAAERCHVSQPALTRAIQKLEEEFGGPLFRRERAKTHLTDLGRLLRPYLEAAYEASETARTQAASFAKLEAAPLKLGIMCTIGPSRLIGVIGALQNQIPALQVGVEEARGGDLVQQLEDGKIDVAVVAHPEYPERLDPTPLYTERYMVAFPRGHRFEAMNAVSFDDLDGEDYVERSNCEFPEHFEALGLKDNTKVNVRYSSDREDWVQAMILAGMGCSVIPEYMPLMPGISTRLIVAPEVSRTVSLVTVAGRRFSPSVQALVKLIQKHRWSASG
jgi:DNA-binding transcriptional LysR family regulator